LKCRGFPSRLLTLFRDLGFSRGKRSLHGLQLLGQRYGTLICFGFPDYSLATFDQGPHPSTMLPRDADSSLLA
jgi:hypothetical protein